MGDFVIGQRAAIYQSDYGEGVCITATVERDTKLYWVANGRKFRKSDGLEPGSNSNWGRSKYLLPLDDPKVFRASIAARKSVAYGRILDAQRVLGNSREDLHAIESVVAALHDYAKVIAGSKP
jgi:hypothetical protein